MSRRLFIKQALSTAVASLLMAQSGFAVAAQSAKRKVIIDADTANEIDDLYAIVRALLEPNWQILALSSAQWHTRTSPPDTVFQSQRLNEDILRLMNRQDIPAPLGDEMIMGKPWGGTDPRDSAAVQMMIAAARQMPAGEKLTILSLGAVTNLASAIKIAPDILPKISTYILSGRFFADRKVWDKDEFNLRNDLNAANFLFNTQGLELHLMPVNILLDFKFDLKETCAKLQGKGAIWDYLAARWLSHSPGQAKRVMWDLASVEALIRPELFTEAEFMTPPENVQRKIFVYTSIKHQEVANDFWTVIEQAQRKR
jgi:purine nucleosidase